MGLVGGMGAKDESGLGVEGSAAPCDGMPRTATVYIVDGIRGIPSPGNNEVSFLKGWLKEDVSGSDCPHSSTGQPGRIMTPEDPPPNP